MLTEKCIDTINFLERCAAIERLRADTYDLLARAYSNNQKIYDLFSKTAEEERNHERQFLLARRSLVPSISAVLVNGDQLDKFADFAEEAFRDLRKELPTIEEALKMAILSETAFRQFHMDTAVIFEDSSLSQLFEAMMDGDEYHVESLKQAHAEYTGHGA